MYDFRIRGTLQIWSEYFPNIVNSYKPLTIFVKHSILDVWQSSDYAFVICYSLFGKTEDANKIDSVAM